MAADGKVKFDDVKIIDLLQGVVDYDKNKVSFWCDNQYCSVRFSVIHKNYQEDLVGLPFRQLITSLKLASVDVKKSIVENLHAITKQNFAISFSLEKDIDKLTFNLLAKG